jgi:thiol-disulfide isomerase/thioredoxin
VTALADMLVAAGKKAEGLKALDDFGTAKSSVRGLKQHLEGIAKNYELIGSDPIAMGQNDIAGKAINLADYKGKVLMIDFWATWCGPCMGELPNVLAAYAKFHDQGFEILGISLDENKEAFEKCIADRKMSWRHFFDGKGWKNEIAQAYGVNSIPATYLVGPDGKVAAVGARGERLEKEIARLLGKPAKK